MCHAFGSYATYPMSDRPRLFTPPEEANVDALLRMHDGIGIERAVVVQPTCYGTDNRVTIDALTAGAGRYVGIALIDNDTTDSELDHLHEAGMIGARFHDIDWLDFRLSVEELAHHVSRTTRLGWVMNLHVMPDFLLRNEEALTCLDAQFVLDHMLWLGPEDHDHPVLDVFSRLHKRGNWWIKLSNTDRLSTLERGFADIIPLMQTLVALAPDRTVWGTDWAHTLMKKSRVAADREIVELLFEAVPDEIQRRKILVDNPDALFASS